MNINALSIDWSFVMNNGLSTVRFGQMKGNLDHYLRIVVYFQLIEILRDTGVCNSVGMLCLF